MAKVGIVGAGISGLATAIALRAARHEVELFERAAELREVGSGLTLWSNATRVLRELGVLEQCLVASQPIELFCLRLASGRALMSIPIDRFETSAVAMHRADLQSALHAAVPRACIHTNAPCDGVRDGGNGVFLRFADGERGPFDLVIGADGLRSTIREAVLGVDEPAYRGYYVWRGVAALGLSDHPPGRISETWGRGERFGILPMGGGRVCWYATANRPLAAASPPEERQGRLLQQFGAWHGPIGALIRATPAHAILENPAFDRHPRRGWSRGSVLLIGDAAHPLTPNLGQGACMALEDAMVLSKVLGDAGEGRPLGAALADFEARRFRRIAAMVRRCRLLGSLGQWQAPVVTAARNAIAAKLPGGLFAYTSRAIQAYAADQEVAAPGGSAPRLR